MTTPPLGREVLHFRFSFEETRPLAGEVLTVLGYRDAAAPGVVMATLEELFTSTANLWAIEGGFAVCPAAGVELAAERLLVEDVTFEVGKTVAGQLSRAEAVAVFLCTAGPGIERWSRDLVVRGDPFTGYIADTLASLVVEKAMDAVQERLEKHARGLGLRITNRYSPGYCGWDVGEQQKLFGLLPPGFCGVSLTESSLMRPIKTVSGVIGIGGRVKRNPYTCHLCDLEDCLYRRLAPPPADS